MLEKIRDFIVEKTGDFELSNGMFYLCPGGSFVTGTNDETSDLDYRAVVFLGDDYHYGLKHFDHTKLVSGEGKINQYLDFDVDIYSLRHFVERAYIGEFVPIEMLFCDRDFVSFETEIFQKLREHRSLFLSKSIVFKYSGYVKGMRHKMKQPLKNFRRPDYIERVKAFGYETKSAMKAILIRQLCIEFMETGVLNLRRSNAATLLEIKRGKYTLTEVEDYLQALDEQHESLLHSCDLPNKPDFDAVNRLLVDLQKELLALKLSV